MKIYNIHNGRTFFEKLASCEGAVELVNEDGKHLELVKNGQTPDMVPFTYFEGAIRQMELVFQKSEDCARIFSYLVNTGALSR